MILFIPLCLSYLHHELYFLWKIEKITKNFDKKSQVFYYFQVKKKVKSNSLSEDPSGVWFQHKAGIAMQVTVKRKDGQLFENSIQSDSGNLRQENSILNQF